MSSKPMGAVALLLWLQLCGCATAHYHKFSGQYLSSNIVDGRYVSTQPIIQKAKLAIAEIGEQQPSQSLLWEAKFLRPTFDGATPVSGGAPCSLMLPSPSITEFSDIANYRPRKRYRDPTAGKLEAGQIHDSADQAISAAREVGARYLLLSHMRIEGRGADTSASWLELLVLPMWLAPTERVRAEGEATLALIDAQDGAVLFLGSTTQHPDALVPYIPSLEAYERRLEREFNRIVFDQLRNYLAAR